MSMISLNLYSVLIPEGQLSSLSFHNINLIIPYNFQIVNMLNHTMCRGIIIIGQNFVPKNVDVISH